MIFSSIEYIIFFAVVLAALAAARGKSAKKIIIVAASYVFYSFWDYRFTLLIFSMTAANYFFGNALSAGGDASKRRFILVCSIVFNLGILGFFKYFNFFVDGANYILGGIGARLPSLNIILPVAISFITFEVMSYTIDIYRGEGKPARNFIDFALLVSFFPHLIAGPILKPNRFLPQLDDEVRIKLRNIEEGAQIFMLGLVKKVLIADRAAMFADRIFEEPALYASPTVWLAVISYSIQIYCDFSAYSDMAIGSARCMGLNIPRNFNLPYSSENIAEFWRRWHISLSNWLRDYLYISLGGNRRGKARLYANLMITMLLGGLWHGASWNFVAWGGLHGAALVAHRMWSGRVRVSGAAARAFNIAATFALVSFFWIFFRAPDFQTAFAVVNKVLLIGDIGGVLWIPPSFAAVVLFILANHVYGRLRDEYIILPMKSIFAIFAYTFILFAIFYLAPAEAAPFIYFQF